MEIARTLEEVRHWLPGAPDAAMQQRISRAQPLRDKLVKPIRLVWTIVLAGQAVTLAWLGVRPLELALSTLLPAFFLLASWIKVKPVASAFLFVSVVLGVTLIQGIRPFPQYGGAIILTIVLSGLLVGEFFVWVWTFVSCIALQGAAMLSAGWLVSAGWCAVYVAAGWLVILFSRNLERLLDESFAAEEQLRGAIVEERTRFAREIHDTLAQGFTGIMMQLNAAEQRLQPDSSARQHLEKARELARESLDQARRSVSALRMGVLANSTLLEAIEQIGRQIVAESKVKFETRLEGAPCQLNELRESNLLRIAQEALTNAARHSGADRISVRLAYQPGSTALEIEDNGRGISDLTGGGFGVEGIRERVRQIGGQIDIRTQPDRGTRVFVIVPNV